MDKHDCINHFGDIIAKVQWTKDFIIIWRKSECEKCGKKFENQERKIKRVSRAYGCQLERIDWEEVL